MEVSPQYATQIVVGINDPSHAGEARRLALNYAEAMDLGESDRGAVGIAVTEMVTNVIKHAGTGKIIFESMVDNGTCRLRALAIDKGPGIPNITAALEDGHSTAGTMGSGLGAIRRLSTVFDIYSMPGHGTCVLAEFWPQRKLPKSGGLLQLAGLMPPKRRVRRSVFWWKLNRSPRPASCSIPTTH